MFYALIARPDAGLLCFVDNDHIDEIVTMIDEIVTMIDEFMIKIDAAIVMLIAGDMTT